MRAARQDTVDAMLEVMNNAQHCMNARELTFDNEWQRMFPVHGAIHPPSPLTTDIFEPLYIAISDLIRKTPRVTHLRFVTLGLTPDMLSEVSAHPSIRSLSLDRCYLAIPRIAGIADYMRGPLQNVTYLALGFGLQTQTYRPLWLVTSMCPQLRWLYVHTAAHGMSVCYPMPELHHAIPFVHTVEHLHFQGMTNFVSGLILWMETASREIRVPSRLSRLKIHSAVPMFEEDVEWLLETLSQLHAGIRVLVLEGIEISSPSIVQHIATTLPDLEGLTLIRRANASQRCNQLCLWPDPIYEYAEQLRTLRNLRHFEANFVWSRHAYGPESVDLLATLDDDPMTPPSRASHSLDKPDTRTGLIQELDDHMDDGLAVVLPFAASCHTLESFALRADAIVFSCRISRESDRYTFFDVRNFEQALGFEQWNPSTPGTWTTNV